LITLRACVSLWKKVCSKAPLCRFHGRCVITRCDGGTSSDWRQIEWLRPSANKPFASAGCDKWQASAALTVRSSRLHRKCFFRSCSVAQARSTNSRPTLSVPQKQKEPHPCGSPFHTHDVVPNAYATVTSGSGSITRERCFTKRAPSSLRNAPRPWFLPDTLSNA
jgi:hypothetical protein